MFKRIELHNFMSHAHTVIEPAEGLTVLVGPNNCGKSAVVSALHILSQNTSGDYMVRHGEKECWVAVETEEGHRIEWRRRGGTAWYTLNGQDYHRLRNSIPDELNALLRLARVDAPDGREPYDIHFGLQKSPIFLLNEPGSRAAMFFAASSDAAKLMEMQTLHRDKSRQAGQSEKRLDGYLKRLTGQIGQLEPVVALEAMIAQAEQDYEAILALASRIEHLGQVQASLGAQAGLVKDLAAQAATMANLTSPPLLRDTEAPQELIDTFEITQEWEAHEVARLGAIGVLTAPPALHDTERLEALLGHWAEAGRVAARNGDLCLAAADLASPPQFADALSLEKLLSRLLKQQVMAEWQIGRVSCLKALGDPPLLASVEPLDELLMRLAGAEAAAVQSSEATAVMTWLEAPPSLEDEADIADIVQALTGAEREWVTRTAVCGELDRMAGPPQLDDLNPLAGLIGQVDAVQQQATTHAGELTAVQQAIAQAQDGLGRWAREHRLCPTCGAELDAGRLIALATSGLGGCAHA